MTPSDLPFREIWLHDFEFIPQPGEYHDVVCLVAYELRSGRTLRLWRDQLGASPPYRTDDDALFVNFVANAECACHLALGWRLPAKVLDLNPVFRNVANGRSTPDGKGLLGALRYYGLDAIATKQKDAMQKRVMQGWPFTSKEQQGILDYCASDIDALRRLLPKMLAEPEFDLGVALYHGEFASVSASSRLSNGRFAKGHSGNPHGPKVYLERQAASKAHAAELLKALVAELGGKPSAVDLAFASQAAAMLAKAHYSEKHRVLLTTKASVIIDRLRARYPAKKRLPSLRELGL